MLFFVIIKRVMKMREKLLIINASPRKNGVCAEVEKQIRSYFIEMDIEAYNTYELNPAPCIACGYCEQNKGCCQHDLDDFFIKFEEADYIAIFSPVYNNFFPSTFKALLDRFQWYYSLRFSHNVTPPVNKSKRVGMVLCSGSKCVPVADYMINSLKQSLTILNSSLTAKYYIPSTDIGKYSFNIIELEKFIHMLKG